MYVSWFCYSLIVLFQSIINDGVSNDRKTNDWINCQSCFDRMKGVEWKGVENQDSTFWPKNYKMSKEERKKELFWII